jgi:hypothetical protein
MLTIQEETENGLVSIDSIYVSSDGINWQNSNLLNLPGGSMLGLAALGNTLYAITAQVSSDGSHEDIVVYVGSATTNFSEVFRQTISQTTMITGTSYEAPVLWIFEVMPSTEEGGSPVQQ